MVVTSFRRASGCVLLLMVLLGCDGGSKGTAPPEAQSFVNKVEGEIQPQACPARGEIEQERLAEEQVSRSEIEALRRGVDSRSAFRAVRSARLAEACTPQTHAQWTSRRELADMRWKSFVDGIKLALYQKDVARRAKSQVGQTAALRSVISLIQEAAPGLAERLKAEVRLLEPKRK